MRPRPGYSRPDDRAPSRMCTRPGAGRRLEIVAEIPCASSASRMFLQRSSELHTTQTARFCWTKPAMSAAAISKEPPKAFIWLTVKLTSVWGASSGTVLRKVSSRTSGRWASARHSAEKFRAKLSGCWGSQGGRGMCGSIWNLDLLSEKWENSGPTRCPGAYLSSAGQRGYRPGDV